MHSSSKQPTIQEKQTFLRTQIIDSGVDPQSFMIFMGAAKNQGQNINLQKWSFNQLKKVVHDFKQSLQAQLKRQQSRESKIFDIQALHKNRSSMEVANRVMGSKLPKKQKVFYERDDLWDYEMINKQQIKKTPRFFQLKAYPQVNIKGVQVKKTGGYIFGIGAKSYIQVILAPNFSTVTIARKSEDTDWLRSQLISMFPGSYLPPLQQSPSLQTEDKAVIAKRARQINQFLNSLVHFDHLLNNKFTHMYLTESNQKVFQNFKSKNNTTPPIGNIHSLQNLQGYFSAEISQRMQDLVKNSSKYSKQVNQILKNIQQNLTKLQNDYINITKHYSNLSQDFGKLKQKYITLSQKSKFYKNQVNTEFDKRTIALFSNLKTVVSTLQVHSKKQTFFIKDFNQQIIKVMTNQWNQFDLLQKKHRRQLQSYLTLKLMLSKKKQQFFLDLSKRQLEQRQKNINSVQTTLSQKQQLYKIKHPSQSKLQQQRKTWQGYVNYMYQYSFVMLLNQQQKQMQRKLNKLYPLISSMLNQRNNIYSNFQKYMNQQANKMEHQVMLEVK